MAIMTIPVIINMNMSSHVIFYHRSLFGGMSYDLKLSSKYIHRACHAIVAVR